MRNEDILGDAAQGPPLPRKLEELVTRLIVEFGDKQVGHCVRVDHLSADDGLTCCSALQARLPASVTALVLSHEAQDALHVPADKAIELRNRKRTSLCLFVPATLQDAAVSSLGNSFSPFDLAVFLRDLSETLRSQVPDDLSEMIGAVLRQLRGSARVPVEDVIGFLSAVLDAPQPETVGAELWRVGLIPDFSGHEDFARRIDLNRSSVERLTRPPRAYASVAERVASLKLSSETIQAELIQYLMGKRLQSDRAWLRTMTEEPWRGTLTFDRWKFADVEQSELERVDVLSFYEKDRVRAGWGLEQDAPGSMPYARCGPKKTVVVRWQPEPTKLTDVKHWRVEMVPGDKYDTQDAAGADLPQVTVRGSLRQAKVPLDGIEDVENLEIREVQIRVVGLDTNGSEILGLDSDEPIEGRSESFYLEQNDREAVEGVKPRRMATERCLPDAMLTWAMRTKDKERRVTPLAPEDRDLLYLPFKVNDRAVVRVATTTFLRKLEEDTLASYASGGRWAARVSGVDALTREKAASKAMTINEDLLPPWDRFLQARKQVFDTIAGQAGRGLVETADLTPTLCRNVQRYARAYCDLLDSTLALARETTDPLTPETIEALLTIDTLTLDFQYLSGPRRATVFLPTHPLRLLWYVAYSEWVAKIEQELLAIPISQRPARMSDKTLHQISPLNMPALLVRPTTGDAEIFTENLTLFHAVTLPMEVSDPGTLVSEVARVLGLDGYEAALADLQPDEAAAEVATYLKLHSYLKTLRVSAVNPGSGEFLRSTLEMALHGLTPDPDEEVRDGVHLDLITHSESDIQAPSPGLEALSREWYHRGQRQRGNHLRPAVQVARRLLTDENLRHLPGGDVHLSFCLDHYRPTIGLRLRGVGTANDTGEATEIGAAPKGTSASVFGLLTRLQTQFTSHDGTAVWERGVSFQGDQMAERHPVNRLYSDLLVEVQTFYLTMCGLALGGDPNTSPQPTLRLEVGPEERRLVSTLHQQSDWLITIDRHFGVEYYDAPQDTYLAKEAGHYLLDYTPEFVDGLGHRLLVTTQWKEEIADILGRAMDELGLARNPVNCGDLLTTLKMVSGRLALRLIGSDSGEVGQDTLAKETVSLGVVANYLEHRGELKDAILVPLDAHKRLFFDAKNAQATDSGSRCDLLLVRPSKQRLVVEYIEVKYRQGPNPIPSTLLDQIADQTARTDKTLRAMYFAEPPRLDAPILRCQLAAILRFYAERAHRHGRMTDEGRYADLLDHLMRVEMGLTKLVSKYRGLIVNLNGSPRKSFKHGDTTIQILTGIEVERETDFQVSAASAHKGVAIGETSDIIPTEEAEVLNRPLTMQMETAPVAAATAETQAANPVLVDAFPSPEKQPKLPPTTPNPRHLAVPLGLSTHSEEEVSWDGSVEGSPHLFVMGIPGQGKSWSVLRLISQVTQQNVPALILDFHGQFSDSRTPFGAAAKPLVLDVSEGLPFSPFEVLTGTGPSQWKTNSFQVAEIIQYLCELGDMQRDLVYEAIRDSYKAAGFADVGTMDDTEPLVPPTMTAVFERLRALEQERKGIKNTAARVRPLFEFDLFRENGAPVNFAETRNRTTVIDLHRVGMETLQAAAGAFVLRKLYKDMFQWGETDRLRLLVVLDEAHRLAKDLTLPKLMKEGRKFGIAAVVASQTMQDFHPEVLQNAGTKILYRTNYPQSKKVSGYLKAPHYIPDVVARLEGLAVGHALVQTPQMPTCAEVAMYPYAPLSDSEAQ